MRTIFPQLVLSAFLLQPLLAGPPEGKRLVFLGDSITYAGEYVERVETALITQMPERPWEVIDLGLPSETVSGLSEPGHAGGQFPRPNLHERLDRVLAKVKPEVVVACYGMNCGMYHPFSEERFAAYKTGIELLRKKVQAAGAKIIHLTPPTFDPVPIQKNTLPAGLPEYRKPYAGYNEVLDRYSEWLLAQRSQGWEVIDIHGPMNAALKAGREKDPGFKFAGDGVHANSEGHQLMAAQILQAWKLEVTAPPAEILKLVTQRQKLLKDAWLTETGHQRPGMAKGLPMAEAQAKAAELGQQLAAALQRGGAKPIRLPR